MSVIMCDTAPVSIISPFFVTPRAGQLHIYGQIKSNQIKYTLLSLWGNLSWAKMLQQRRAVHCTTKKKLYTKTYHCMTQNAEYKLVEYGTCPENP